MTSYTYRADGVKLKKSFALSNDDGTTVINTEYLDGFQYSTPNTEPIRRALSVQDDSTVAASKANEEEAFTRLEERTVAVAPVDPAADDMVLSFFPTAEGYYDYENMRYIYQYKDHLGNVRVSYVKDSSTGALKVMDTNDYYPFGMNFIKPLTRQVYDPLAIPYNYKYNGKELQETGMYDFGARQYMPDLGRWGVVDPLAETTRRWTPYNYALDNPVMFVDPDGRKVYDSPIMEWSAGLSEDSFMNMNGYNRRDFNRRGGTGGGGSGSGTNGNYNNAIASGDYTGFWNSVLKLYGLSLYNYSFDNITPALAGIYAHRTLAQYINDNNQQGYWHTEKGINFWNQDLKLRPDIYYMNNGMNAVWELKPDTQMMNSFSFKGQSQAEGYAYALSIQKKQQFYTGSSHGAPPPIMSGTPLTDRLGYSFTYTIPKGTDGMIYYTCNNCRTPEREPATESWRVPAVRPETANAVGAGAVLLMVLRFSLFLIPN